MSHTFTILGAGMQGTAAAFDLARYASPRQIVLADYDLAHAEKSATRVNGLTHSKVCAATQVNALEEASLREAIQGAAVVLSCVPYWMHPRIAPVAIAAGVNMVDMGGSTVVARETLKFDGEAKAAGVTVVPDTGLAPGLVNNLGSYLIEEIDEIESVRLFCGGLPQHPKPPFNYKLLFNVEGLVTEYCDEADVLRDGELLKVPTLSELETIEIEGLGTMEAFVTSGGTSTAPETWLGRVPDYQYKTIRFPGHCALMRIFKDFGFWGKTPVDTREGPAVPREVWHALMGPALQDQGDKDQVIVRAVGVGKHLGKPKRIQLDIRQLHDDTTGFTAMEQLTGTSTAIYAAAIAGGEVAKGCLRYETALSGKRFVEELGRRPIQLKAS